MLIFGAGCEALDSAWDWLENNTPLFNIPVLSNILNAVLSYVYGLFGCDAWE